ncbi:MAG: MFS transporter [Promethearchaeota archaeon]
MSEKIPRKILLAVILINFAGQIAWAVENQYYNVFMYNVIAPVPLYISILVAVTTIVGTVAAIIMGSYSDVKGKRKSIIILGFIFWGITTAIFPLAALFRPIILAVLIAILFDSIMTFFGSTALNAGFNAYVTDVTNEENRGKVMGIVQVVFLMALIITYGVSGFFIQLFGYFIYFYIVGIVVGIIGILGSFLIEDSEELKPLNISIYVHIKNTFKGGTLKNHKDYVRLLISVAVFETGFYVFFPFLLIYLEHYVGLSLSLASILIFIAMLVSMLLGYPFGILTDRIGRKKMALVSALLMGLFLIIFALVLDVFLLLLFGTCWLVFYIAWTIATLTWIKDLYPEEGRGQFSGYWNLFNATIPMVIGAFLGGWLALQYGIPIVRQGVSGTVPTPLIFIVGGLIVLISIIPHLFVNEMESENIIKTETREE